MLDTKGPEIRTAMLRGGQDIAIVAGQEVTLAAVGAEYTSFEGFKDEATGETVVGCSYAKLCSSVSPGMKILCADGTLSLEVLRVGDGSVVCKALNDKVLGQRKNMNLPGVKVRGRARVRVCLCCCMHVCVRVRGCQRPVLCQEQHHHHQQQRQQ